MYKHILASAAGRIFAVMSSPQASILIEDDTVAPETHWYDWEDRQPKLKAPMQIVLTDTGVDGVPCPCELTIQGTINTSTRVSQGSTPITFDLPGTYSFVFTPSDPRWLETTCELEVPE